MLNTASLSVGWASLTTIWPALTFWPGFGADGGDHAVEIGFELGVFELVVGQVEVGLGGSQLGFGGAQIAQRGVVVGLRRPAVLQQFSRAGLRRLRLDQRGLGRGDVRFRGAQPVLVVLDVETGRERRPASRWRRHRRAGRAPYRRRGTTNRSRSAASPHRPLGGRHRWAWDRRRRCGPAGSRGLWLAPSCHNRRR